MAKAKKPIKVQREIYFSDYRRAAGIQSAISVRQLTPLVLMETTNLPLRIISTYLLRSDN